ncbi:hypothetical protein IWQ57_003252 [Coemansia nantahalensis]|uniref:Uncharacterized protein n=1 Tax=Coemansia nantahalensis TaxID=2789366 RepID=A0ACC1JWW9_9FUNG|nr:hypothetical protein IWQ57_003252 [Coemansia nantahalensis]
MVGNACASAAEIARDGAALLQSSVKHILPPSETTQAVVRALGTNAAAFVCQRAVVKAASFVGALPLSDSTPAAVRAASIGLINYACGRAVDKLSSRASPPRPKAEPVAPATPADEPLRGTTLGVVRRAADAAAYAAAYAVRLVLRCAAVVLSVLAIPHMPVVWCDRAQQGDSSCTNAHDLEHAEHELVATAHAFGKDADNLLLSGNY